MRYRPFGRTGLQVSVVGFGCWPMAGDRYGAIEDDEAVKANPQGPRPGRELRVSQVGYHMLDRRQKHETFPGCLTNGIGVMGYGSLGHGLLTGAFTAATTFGDPSRDWRGGGVAFGQPIFRGENLKTNIGVVDRLRREVAEPRGVPLSQIALAWVLGNPAISTALVGARTPAEVDANDAGTELDLTPAERAKIETI